MSEAAGEGKTESPYAEGPISGWRVIGGFVAAVGVLVALVVVVALGSAIKTASDNAPPALTPGQTVEIKSTVLGCKNKADVAEFFRLRKVYGDWGAANEFAAGRCRAYGEGLSVRVIETEYLNQMVCIAQNSRDYPCNWVARAELKP